MTETYLDATFTELRELDRSLLALAVQNSNVKAQRLAFGPAREAADGFADRLQEVARSAPGTDALRVALVRPGEPRHEPPGPERDGVALELHQVGRRPVGSRGEPFADPVGAILALAAVVTRLDEDRSIATVGPLTLLTVVAVLGRLGSTGGPLCDPGSLLQPHAVWHLGAAVALAWWAIGTAGEEP